MPITFCLTRCQVFTSDMKGAGTDANIDINLLGEGGETGYHPLVANYDTFEKGAVSSMLRMVSHHH